MLISIRPLLIVLILAVVYCSATVTAQADPLTFSLANNSSQSLQVAESSLAVLSLTPTRILFPCCK